MDPDELSPEQLGEWVAMQTTEGQQLGRVLALAPQLARLEASGVGPELFARLLAAVDEVGQGWVAGGSENR